MEWSQPIVEWWSGNAVVISLVEFGLLIVGGIVTSLAAWWRHRSLTGRINDLEEQNREILRLMQSMKGCPIAEQERIVAEAKRLSVSATASFGPMKASATLRKRPARTEEGP